jgi:hypothetical protein
MKHRFLKVGLVAGALAVAAGSGVGHGVSTTCAAVPGGGVTGANTFAATDTASCVIEPILTRSSLAPIYVNDGDLDNLNEANIKSFSMSAVGGSMSATIGVAATFPTSLGALVSTVRPPYGGVHVLVLFQSDTLDVEQPIGGTANLGPFKRADGFHWFLYYGNTLSEGGNPQCGIGYYDPFGQVFFVITQDTLDVPNNLSCSASGTNVTISTPYITTWTDVAATGNIARSLKLVTAGTAIQKAKAFSWMDHEVGGPPPVGLVVGATWYLDALPAIAYNYGKAWAGDPNSGGIPGPTCQYFVGRRVPNPLYTGSACYIATPAGLGTGFNSTPLTITAG